jgi:hypothetical protein
MFVISTRCVVPADAEKAKAWHIDRTFLPLAWMFADSAKMELFDSKFVELATKDYANEDDIFQACVCIHSYGNA